MSVLDGKIGDRVLVSTGWDNYRGTIEEVAVESGFSSAGYNIPAQYLVRPDAWYRRTRWIYRTDLNKLVSSPHESISSKPASKP